MRWTPSLVFLLLAKNLTGSGKWATRFYRECGAKIHPTAKFDGSIGTRTPETVEVCEELVVGFNSLLLSTHVGHRSVRIGKRAFVGAMCVILGKDVGDGATLGAGSVLTHDVPPGEVWAGNPARKLR